MKRGYLYPPAVGFWPGLKPCQGFREHPPRLTWFPDRFHLRPRAGGQAGSQRITPGRRRRWRRAGVAPLSPTSLSLSLSLYTHTQFLSVVSLPRSVQLLSVWPGRCSILLLRIYDRVMWYRLTTRLQINIQVRFMMNTIRLTWKIIGVRFWEFPNFFSDKPITWARVLVNVLNALIQLLSKIEKQYHVVFLFIVYDNNL